MGRDRKLTKAELRQREKNQEDPRWLAWLAEMDARIGKFLGETVPDMPENPWTTEGLAHAEAQALKWFSDWETVWQPENRDVADQLSRYVGEVFRINFEGEWWNIPSFDDPDNPLGFGPVISMPHNPEYLDVVNLLTATVHRRTGTEWSTIFGNVTESFGKWKSAQVD